MAQEKEKEEALVIKSIVYLGENGFLDEPGKTTEVHEPKDTADAQGS